MSAGSMHLAGGGAAWCPFIAASAAVWLSAAPVPALAGVEPDEWIVAVELKNKVLAEELPVLVDDHEVYLPLVQFSALLLIPVERDKAGNFVGTVSSTEYSFSVDPASRRLQINGAPAPLKPADIHAVRDDVYVASAVTGDL